MSQLKLFNYLPPESLHQSQWEKGHVVPCGTLMMGTWWHVPNLPNGHLQACPYCCCAPVHMLHSATASRVVIHLLLLTSPHFFHAAMYS